ncbi:coiled-coil domain-containing protein 77 [Takifugu flavidus]|uniref:Coiled-coil domain-containing protein 77 n=1 Tax=Takifugu flavidus TaxID=433684 RepID=A0A5C6PBH4_9TELE|nr:coiled-coil domain-containing protein 77 [Takifugu flavidus]TWW75640.1 Coiled-coil domain-containing protein 77 [Takifugu flavidus]
MGSPTKGVTPRRSNVRTPAKDSDSPLPSIHERLAYLRPSRELLDFYRQKIAQFDEEHAELQQMLEQHRRSTEDQHKLQWDIQQREGEIVELQNALSDMQLYLFQEREQALRLYAENDRLKIRELEDRKKIQHLLDVVGPDEGEITYFHREPPHKVIIAQKGTDRQLEEHLSLRPTKLKPAGTRREINRRKKSMEGGDGDILEQYKSENQTLLLQVEALQVQMEEQTRLAKDQIETLLEDRRIKAEEAETRRIRDQEQIRTLTDRLQRTENQLCDCTKDLLQLKFDSRAQEKSWMAEKDQLLRKMDSCHNCMRRSGPAGAEPPSSAAHPLSLSQQARKEGSKITQEKLKQAHHLAEMYREQCVAQESELAQIKEERDAGRELFKERSEKMAKRLQLMTKRCETLERRRAMEAEGFKSDLKILKQRFKDIEKQLFKATLNIGPNQDLAVLHEVRQTNTRTKKVQGELMALKAKIYGLENELRFS